MRVEDKSLDYEEHLRQQKPSDELEQQVLAEHSRYQAAEFVSLSQCLEQILNGQGRGDELVALMPDHLRPAVEFIQTAAKGRDPHERTLFAEDRRDMLEQALAALRPVLSVALDGRLGLLPALDRLGDRVLELRATLDVLTEAQEELHAMYPTRQRAQDEGESDEVEDGEAEDGEDEDGEARDLNTPVPLGSDIDGPSSRKRNPSDR